MDDQIEKGVPQIDVEQAVANLKSFIEVEKVAIEVQKVPPELKDIHFDSDEVVEACIEAYLLPGTVAELFRWKHPRMYDADFNAARALAVSAEDTKKIYVDATTGLETTEVMRYRLAMDLKIALELAKESTSNSIPLEQAIAETRSKISDEYQLELDRDLEKVQQLQHPELDDPEKLRASQDKLTRHILRRNFLLSHMSTIAVGGSDIQGMKNTNTFFGLNPRDDMDYEEATNQLGIKKLGRTYKAVTKLTGSDEYNKTLEALKGDRVKVWESEDTEEIVDGQFYEDRARSLIQSEDLQHLQEHQLRSTMYRRRIEAGDEGNVMTKKAKLTPDGRPISLTPQDIRIMEKAFRDASYVKVGEFTLEQSQELVDITKMYLGDRCVLSADEPIPVYLQNRVSIVRLDQAFKQAIDIDSLEFEELSANPDKLVIKAVDIALTLSGNTMEQSKGDEPKNFLKAAINGDPLAQVYLAQSDVSGRALANPRELVGFLSSPPLSESAQISDEQFGDLYPRVEHRGRKLSPSKKK